MTGKIIGVRLEDDLRKWFEDHLEKYSYADKFSARKRELSRVFTMFFPELSYLLSAVDRTSYNCHLFLEVAWELLFNAWASDTLI